jgi:uracil-DNA glycosylase family 4
MSSRIHYPEEEWKSCQRCLLSLSRRRVVLRGDGRVSNRTVERDGKLIYWRGEIQNGDEPEHLPPRRSFRGKKNIPIILFIGEAPGQQEEATGRPLTDESGRIFNLCLSYCESTFDFEVANILGCRPSKFDKHGNEINRTPEQKEIDNCLPRLEKLISHVHYDGIVYLGDIPQKFKITRKMLGKAPPPTLSLRSPLYLLRQEFKLYDIKEFALKLDKYVSINFET